VAVHYPDVNDEVYRLHFLKQDRLQSRRVVRVVMWALPLLAFLDFYLLVMSDAFWTISAVRVLIFAYSWWLLKKLSTIHDLATLTRQVSLWSAAVLLMQLINDVMLPTSYFGHYLFAAWMCMIYFIAIPIPVGALRPAMLLFLVLSFFSLALKVKDNLPYILSVAVMLLTSAYTGNVIGAYLHRYRKKILSAEMEIERQAITDPVTGVVNRREFIRVGSNEIQRHGRLGKNLSVLILDLDHLKQISENYGRHASDIVLIEVTKRIKRATRDYDCLARFGTEEFCVLLPDASAEVAVRIAARARETVIALPIPFSGKELRVTASVGVATMLEGDSAETILKRAEEALNKSKPVFKQQMSSSQMNQENAFI
jgi:diguanylate cyclase (GGDEF)-like protein